MHNGWEFGMVSPHRFKPKRFPMTTVVLTNNVKEKRAVVKVSSRQMSNSRFREHFNRVICSKTPN